jgi:hypothetical protein
VSADALADLAIAATFAALAMEGDYTPAVGEAITVKLVPRAGDSVLAGLGGGQQLHDGLQAEVRVADLPAGSPAAGDVITVGGRDYRIRSWRHADVSRLLWLLDAVPA